MRLGLGLALNIQKNNSSESLILDDFEGAVRAYSLRYLSSSYTGDVVLARNSNNDELGLAPNQITNGTAVSFANEGDGNLFIKTWYDQSGNSSDATQATTTFQGKLVNSGTLITTNGKPSVQMGAITSYYTVSSFTPISTFFVAKIDTLHVANYAAWGAIGLLTGGTITGADGTGVFDGSFKTISGEDTNQHLHYWNYNGSNFEVSVDGNSPSSLSSGSNGSFIELFGRSNTGSLSFNGKVQEIIFYTPSQSGNKSAIESAINSHYLIY